MIGSIGSFGSCARRSVRKAIKRLPVCCSTSYHRAHSGPPTGRASFLFASSSARPVPVLSVWMRTVSRPSSGAPVVIRGSASIRLRNDTEYLSAPRFQILLSGVTGLTSPSSRSLAVNGRRNSGSSTCSNGTIVPMLSQYKRTRVNHSVCGTRMAGNTERSQPTIPRSVCMYLLGDHRKHKRSREDCGRFFIRRASRRRPVASAVGRSGAATGDHYCASRTGSPSAEGTLADVVIHAASPSSWR